MFWTNTLTKLTPVRPGSDVAAATYQGGMCQVRRSFVSLKATISREACARVAACASSRARRMPVRTSPNLSVGAMIGGSATRSSLEERALGVEVDRGSGNGICVSGLARVDVDTE